MQGIKVHIEDADIDVEIRNAVSEDILLKRRRGEILKYKEMRVRESGECRKGASTRLKCSCNH